MNNLSKSLTLSLIIILTVLTVPVNSQEIITNIPEETPKEKTDIHKNISNNLENIITSKNLSQFRNIKTKTYIYVTVLLKNSNSKIPKEINHSDYIKYNNRIEGYISTQDINKLSKNKKIQFIRLPRIAYPTKNIRENATVKPKKETKNIDKNTTLKSKENSKISNQLQQILNSENKEKYTFIKNIKIKKAIYVKIELNNKNTKIKNINGLRESVRYKHLVNGYVYKDKIKEIAQSQKINRISLPIKAYTPSPPVDVKDKDKDNSQIITKYNKTSNKLKINTKYTAPTSGYTLTRITKYDYKNKNIEINLNYQSPQNKIVAQVLTEHKNQKQININPNKKYNIKIKINSDGKLINKKELILNKEKIIKKINVTLFSKIYL